MLMMLPLRLWSIINWATCLVKRKAPVRMTAVCRVHSASGMSSTPFWLKMTAPLTRMSRPPNVSRACITAGCTWASSVTSHTIPSASPPRCLMYSAHRWAFSGWISTQTTLAPASAMPTAMPPQILGLVPVMRAIFLWSCISLSFEASHQNPHPNPLPEGRGHVNLCPLRRRSRGERAPVKLGALCRRSRRGRVEGLYGALGEKSCKTLVRVEEVGLNPGGLSRFPTQLGHGPRQTHPVEEFLLATLLDCGQGCLAPGCIVTCTQCLVQRSVGRDIWIEEIGLARQKGMRPTGRGNERYPPWTPGQHTGTCGAEIKTAPGHW